jgi:hypothetical protein
MVLVGAFPMRSECREPHHSGKSARIKAFVKPIALALG